MNHVGTLIDQKYFIVSQLDENEVAVTYRVWHVGWETSLTMKWLKKANEQDTFFWIAQAQEWVDLGVHPNIISAYFYRKLDNNLFLFLEGSSGIRLSEIMVKVPQNFAEVISILLEIVHGMAYLQDEGISYRNLCPENIILDKYGRVKLNQIRWNTWEILEMLTKGMWPGTGHFWENINPIILRQQAFRRLIYQPPEYFFQKQEDMTVSHDIYAFGILAYELLYGRLPFELEDDLGNLFSAFRRKHLHKDHIQNWDPSERTTDSEITTMLGCLQPVISACLQPNPNERPTNFSDLSQILLGIYGQWFDKPYIFENFAENILMAMSLNNQALGKLDQGINNEADKILQEVINLHSNSIVAPINRRLFKLRHRNLSPGEFLQQVRKYEAMQDVRYYILCGQLCLESGSLIQQMNDLLGKLNIQDEQIEMLKADLNYRLGDFQRARDVYKSLAYKSSSPNVWYRWGASSFAMKLNKEAQSAWEKGLTLDLPLWDLIIGYSMLLAVQGQWAKARRYLEDAAKNFGKYLHDPKREDIVLWSQVRILPSLQSLPIVDVAILANKRFIIGRSSDGTTHIWEWPSGKKIEQAGISIPPPSVATTRFCRRQAHNKIRQEVAYATNGKVALKIEGTNTIQIWTPLKPDYIEHLSAHTAPVVAIAVTGDGQLAVSGGMDRTLRIWHLDSRRCLGSFTGHQDCVHCLAISENGRRIITASWDRTIRVWDLANSSCISTFNEPRYQITAVAIRSDGEMIAIANTNREVKAFDVNNKKLLATLQGQEQAIYSLAISNDGQMILSAGQDGTVVVYEDIGQRACPLESRAHYFLETLPEPIPLIDRQKKTELEENLLSAANHRQFGLVFEHYQNLIRIQHSCGQPEISLIMAQNLTSTARRNGWVPADFISINLIRTFVHDSPLIGFVLSSPEFFFSLSTKGTLWRCYLHNTKCDFFWRKFSGEFQVMDFCQKNQRFAFLTKDGAIALWSKEGDRWDIIEPQSSTVYSLRMTLNGRHALTGTSDGLLQFWDLDQECLVQEISGHQEMISHILMLPHQRAITSSMDGTWKLWDLNKQQAILTNREKYGPIWTIAIPHTDASVLLTGCSDGNIYIWNLNTGVCQGSIQYQKQPITAIGSCDDGKLLLIGTKDGHLIVWHTPSNKCLTDIQAHNGSIQQVYFGVDGNWAFSASHDATIKAWKLDWRWQQKN